MKGRRVLVTGASGFIGSHLVERLVREGAEVRALVHYRSDPALHNLEFLAAKEMREVEVLRGNIEDSSFVRACVGGCDTVFHLAALIGIPYSYIAPGSYVDTNIKGTLNVLEACRAEATPRLVHTSTSECYGSAIYTPIDEAHPLQAQSPYSASKIAADKLVESFFCSFDLPVATVRPFNTYGPRQSGRAIVPTIVGQLLSGTKALKLGALTPVRDLTYVTDTVDGFVRVARADEVAGEVINLGTSVTVSIGELAETVMRLMGVDVPIVAEAERVRPQKSEVLTLRSDNSKALAILGWAPQVALDDGLRKTIHFFREHQHLLRVREYGV